MQDGTCPKCSATTIMSNLYMPERGRNDDRNLSVEIHENPQALFFTNPYRFALRAWVCGTCGYTELYVNAPQGLYATYQALQQRQQEP